MSKNLYAGFNTNDVRAVKEGKVLKNSGMKKFFCPTYGTEGIVGPYPAGEVCPKCGKEKGRSLHQCNFSLI